MAQLGNMNVLCGSGGTMMYAVKEGLKAAGWPTIASSDGTTYNAAGDQITSGNAGANGFGNTRAWWRGRDPGGRREVTLQHVGVGAGVNGSNYRIKMSESARFSGGAPSATVTPSATDEQVLLGSGTDASPTGAGVSGNATQRVHVVADSSAVGNVYAFQVNSFTPGSATEGGLRFFCEPMAPGSYDAGDVAPCVWFCGGAAFSNTASGWIAYGTASQAWSTAMTYTPGIFIGTMGVDPINLRDVNGFCGWSYVLAASQRSKGVGSRLAAKGPARTHPATANLASANAFYYSGNYCWMCITNTVPAVT